MEAKINILLKDADEFQKEAFKSAYAKYRKKCYWYRSREENDDKYHSFCMKQIPEYDFIDYSWLAGIDNLRYLSSFTGEINPDNYNTTVVYWNVFENNNIYTTELIKTNKLFKEYRVCNKGVCIPIDDGFQYGFMEYAVLTETAINYGKEVIYEEFDKWIKEEYMNGKPTYRKYFKSLKLLVNDILNNICRSKNDWNKIILEYL